MAETVRDVMTPEPVIVASDSTLVEAARLMRDEGIGDVIVADTDQVQGIVTDRDIVVRAVTEDRRPSDTTVGEICSEELVTVGPDEDVDQAVRLMRSHSLRRLPVVDEDVLVGMVSIGDLALDRDEDSALAEISAAPPNT